MRRIRSRWRLTLFRSLGVKPPHRPCFSRPFRAYSRHCCLTSHRAHTDLPTAHVSGGALSSG